MNDKGQASSVFNILIAGVVALAILGILMMLLGGVVNIQGNAVDTAQEQLNKAYRTPYVVHKSGQAITFNKNDGGLSSKAIVGKNSPLVPEQVCFSTGERDTYFESTGNTLTFISPSSQESKLAAFCSETIKEDLPERYSTIELTGCCTDLENELCCVVFPIKP
ncbi:MAG: hypothetical protein ABIA76_00285 [Candidatus Diapherotrites archaeon]